mmetsp:Transcript_7693/g.11923  ORF Transcript_7693/g.11923 Transcript_7693/m.11923 type:complete len:240 (+) Transcript_7693:942-1661(+)
MHVSVPRLSFFVVASHHERVRILNFRLPVLHQFVCSLGAITKRVAVMNILHLEVQSVEGTVCLVRVAQVADWVPRCRDQREKTQHKFQRVAHLLKGQVCTQIFGLQQARIFFEIVHGVVTNPPPQRVKKFGSGRRCILGHEHHRFVFDVLFRNQLAHLNKSRLLVTQGQHVFLLETVHHGNLGHRVEILLPLFLTLGSLIALHSLLEAQSLHHKMHKVFHHQRIADNSRLQEGMVDDVA